MTEKCQLISLRRKTSTLNFCLLKKSKFGYDLGSFLPSILRLEEKRMATQTKSKTTLKPLGNRVLAKRTEKEEAVKGGIILPDSAKKKQETAEVIAVGPGKLNESGKLSPMPVKVGDTILLDQYAGQEVTLDDVEYVIVRADDIIAIVK